jgi:SAM-dependent methyltransferase
MHILDIGCGPGTITVDFAALVPEGRVTAIDYVPDVLEQARALATERGLANVEFMVGDVHSLNFPDATFDVVHAHQLLQHVGDPVQAIREMRRVTKPGGIVACREGDFAAMTWYPEVDGMQEWQNLYQRVARSNGGEPNAGRHVHTWANQAGFDWANIKATAGAWCWQTSEERAWWSGTWADRTISSSFARTAVDGGYATKEDMVRLAQVWRNWGEKEDAWFAVLHGEIICRV